MLSVWWKGMVVLALFGTWIASIFASKPIIASALMLLLLFFFRGLLFWLFNLISNGKTHVEIRENGIGFGRDEADLWIFCDGIRKIKENRWGTTSICHYNGTIVDIPTDYLNETVLNILNQGMEKYLSPGSSPKPTERPIQSR